MHIFVVLCSFVLLSPLKICADLLCYEKEWLQKLLPISLAEEHIADACSSLSCEEVVERNISRGALSNILFQYYPALRMTIPYISLGTLPSPIVHCQQLNKQFSQANIFVKHDGVTGNLVEGKRVFGGNKLRKLQYLLADALEKGHKTVLTFGRVGSNHALQTTMCAEQLGLKSICMLMPQPNSQIVRRNLLLQEAHGGLLYFSSHRSMLQLMTVAACYDHKQRYGRFPYIIPLGGSNARGSIGYVEAAFELKEQIAGGFLPIPDRIYVTLGTVGTAAGLLVGLKAAGLATKMYLVAEEPEDQPGEFLQKMKDLVTETNRFLQSCDSAFPACVISEQDYCIVTDCGGEMYGLFTQEGVTAQKLMYDTEGIMLDGTYTSKCFAALVRDLRSGECNGQTVLLWNTFCGEDFSHITAGVDYHRLPKALYPYFEQEVQELDRI